MNLPERGWWRCQKIQTLLIYLFHVFNCTSECLCVSVCLCVCVCTQGRQWCVCLISSLTIRCRGESSYQVCSVPTEKEEATVIKKIHSFKGKESKKTHLQIFFLGLILGPHKPFKITDETKASLSVREKPCNLKNVQTQFMNISHDVPELHLKVWMYWSPSIAYLSHHLGHTHSLSLLSVLRFASLSLLTATHKAVHSKALLIWLQRSPEVPVCTDPAAWDWSGSQEAEPLGSVASSSLMTKLYRASFDAHSLLCSEFDDEGLFEKKWLQREFLALVQYLALL